MNSTELLSLVEEIRQKIISTCLINGGHLGASLGTIELTVALHRVFDSPQDSVVWDVGHQAYTHKLLTDRWDRFDTLRKFKGISGFLSRSESPHDVFGAGHSSTSLSVASAIAWAGFQKNPSQCPWSIAVIGDGGLTAGLAFEALNNIRQSALGPLLVVLNDNQMSISKNVGSLASYLSPRQWRGFFEIFGFEYIEPIDGHDLLSLISVLEKIRTTPPKKPILLHVLTQKGRGYPPAEESPAKFHGIGPLQKNSRESFSDRFGKAICDLAAKNPKIVAITAAMKEGTGLQRFAERFPDRFFDVGIAEAHAVTFAAGLATQGFIPVVTVYSTFLQRALDSIIHDVAIQNLPVIFAVDRAGLVGSDGPTHHGVFDLVYSEMIPNMKVTSPACLSDLSLLLEQAVESRGPVWIRYPRGSGPETWDPPIQKGLRWHQKPKNPKIIAISVGNATPSFNQVVPKLDPKKKEIAWVSLIQTKPIPTELLQIFKKYPKAGMICLEEGVVQHGFGQRLLASLKHPPAWHRILGYSDHFIQHGNPDELNELEGLSVQKLIKKCQKRD